MEEYRFQIDTFELAYQFRIRHRVKGLLEDKNSAPTYLPLDRSLTVATSCEYSRVEHRIATLWNSNCDS